MSYSEVVESQEAFFPGLFLGEGGQEYQSSPTRGNSLLSLALDNTSIPLYTQLLNKKVVAPRSSHVFQEVPFGAYCIILLHPLPLQRQTVQSVLVSAAVKQRSVRLNNSN